ncbi:MAG: hypothetical protein ACE5G8_16030 [Anaerolineae bacterium]
MTPPISEWPFVPPEQRTPEQTERWWAECHLSSPADVTLHGVGGSVVAYGRPGSGKSVALQAFRRLAAAQWFIVPYPVTRWPGGQQAWVSNPDVGHLGQMMACASMQLQEFLRANPERLEYLTAIDLEYLRWLIEKYSDRRAFRRWANAIADDRLLNLLNDPWEDLYPTDSALQDVRGQIEELVTLCRRLGFNKGVAIVVDIDTGDLAAKDLPEKTRALFGWLTLWQFDGFALKATVPDALVEQTNMIALTCGRATFARLNWTPEESRQLAGRCLRAATAGQTEALTGIASEGLLARLETTINPVYGGPSPQGWARLAAMLLKQYAKTGAPLTEQHFEPVIRNYFAAYIPLKLEEDRPGVWRGPQFIALDEQPYRLLEALWRTRKSDYFETGDALARVAGNRSNLNTIARRLRLKIEPCPGRPVYLRSSRGRGYWLENTADPA